MTLTRSEGGSDVSSIFRVSFEYLCACFRRDGAEGGVTEDQHKKMKLFETFRDEKKGLFRGKKEHGNAVETEFFDIEMNNKK